MERLKFQFNYDAVSLKTKTEIEVYLQSFRPEIFNISHIYNFHYSDHQYGSNLIALDGQYEA